MTDYVINAMSVKRNIQLYKESLAEKAAYEKACIANFQLILPTLIKDQGASEICALVRDKEEEMEADADAVAEAGQ